jgi:hypothetical protein
MPAKSKAQQKLMGMVHAAQTGQIKSPSEKVAKLAKSMTKKSASDYASTKHKGLPKKVKKKSIKENMDYENKVGSMHMVQKPFDGCNVAGMVYEIDPITGIQQHGVDAQTVHGVYSTPEEAEKVAEKLYNEHMGAMKKLEEKKGTVANKLTTAITKLEKKRKEHMDMAKANPKNAIEHKQHVSEIQAKIEGLMDKLAMVEKSKKPIETEEDEKETLKENVDERKWKIGDKFTAGASDVVYTISKVSEKNPNQVIITYTDRKGKNHISPTWPKHIDHYFKKGAWELVDKTNMQENIESDIKSTLPGLDINIRQGKNNSVLTYGRGEQLSPKQIELLQTKYEVYEHEDESDDRGSSYYYTIKEKSVDEGLGDDDQKSDGMSGFRGSSSSSDSISPLMQFEALKKAYLKLDKQHVSNPAVFLSELLSSLNKLGYTISHK